MIASDTIDTLATGVLNGERRALAKVITLFEGSRQDQKSAARQILTVLSQYSGRSIRIGISGTPGAGKSTFIEAFGKILLGEGHKVAILAVDPSSPISGGSILGDRVRMEDLSRDPRVFIRPSPTCGVLGGAARHTRETIVACEAAGYSIIIIESVGVGQSETDVASMSDVFVILQMPHAGDEIQAIKKGILELSDLVVVTKADGGNVSAAKLAKEQLERSLSVARGHTSFTPQVLLVSSVEGRGICEMWEATKDFILSQKKSGEFSARRRTQGVAWFRSEIANLLMERLLTTYKTRHLLEDFEQKITSDELLASTAALEFIDQVFPES